MTQELYEYVHRADFGLGRKPSSLRQNMYAHMHSLSGDSLQTCPVLSHLPGTRDTAVNKTEETSASREVCIAVVGVDTRDRGRLPCAGSWQALW